MLKFFQNIKLCLYSYYDVAIIILPYL